MGKVSFPTYASYLGLQQGNPSPINESWPPNITDVKIKETSSETELEPSEADVDTTTSCVKYTC